MKSTNSILLTWLCAVSLATAAIIPADRVPSPTTYWRDIAGVEGGIPSVSTVFTNVYASNSLAWINGAIAACPSNQVVQFAEGNYTLSGQLTVDNKSGVVLRGAGTNTVLDVSGADQFSGLYVNGINLDQLYVWNAPWAYGGCVDVLGGLEHGSSNIYVTSLSNLVVGAIITIDQTNDYYYVDERGTEGCSGCGRLGGKRSLAQNCEVMALDVGTTNVTIWPPLIAPIWSTNLQPQMFWWLTDGNGRGYVRKVGIENMTLDFADCNPGATPYGSGIGFRGTWNCWVSNVWVINPEISHIYQRNGGRLEVRHSTMRDGRNPGTLSYGLLTDTASFCKFEDNIFQNITAPIMGGVVSYGNVIAYNYITNLMPASYAPYTLYPAISTHDAHNCMHLVEGNHMANFVGDYIHGSASHNTLFRNRITGHQATNVVSGVEYPVNSAVRAITLEQTNRFCSVVGNILGTSGVNTNYEWSYTVQDVTWNWNIYALDGPTFKYPNDQYTGLTLYRHGNWDSANAAITWTATNADHTLPDSMAYASKPAFFGTLDWPPYDPSAVTAADISPTNIPAGFRFIFGYDPPAAVGPEVLVTGNGAVIYNGDLTPSTLDSTHFGTNNVGATVSHTFTVANVGTTALTTSGLTVPLGFTITEGLSATIAAGSSDTFTVRFDSTADGTYTGSVSFGNNDSDENPFSFEVTGITATVVIPSNPGTSQSSTLRVGTIKVN